MSKEYCSTCSHYAVYSGVCCNGVSEYRADFRCLDDTCDKWAAIDPVQVMTDKFLRRE